MNPNVCRICLAESASMESLFVLSPKTKMMLATSLSIVTSLHFSPEDGLPQQICRTCSVDANMALLFKQKCIDADTELRKILATKVNTGQPDRRESMSSIGDISDREILWGETMNNGLLSISNALTADPSPKEVLPQKPMDIKASHQTNVNKSGSQKSKTLSKSTIVKSPKPIQTRVAVSKVLSKPEPKKPSKSGPKVFKCMVCTKNYASEEAILAHMKTMHSKKMFSCLRCYQHFPSLESLEEHNARHRAKGSFGCTLCDKKFNSQVVLDRHAKTHREIGPQLPIECPICHLQFPFAARLKGHMRVHKSLLVNPWPEDMKPEEPATAGAADGDNLWLCTICGIGCKSSSNLAVHERRHKGEMTNFCRVCNKGYPRKTDLTVHMRKHTGEKPFECHICRKTFGRSDRLNIHMRIHTGEKPYTCNLCNRAFIQKNDLVAHKRRDACTEYIVQNRQPIQSNPMIQLPDLY